MKPRYTLKITDDAVVCYRTNRNDGNSEMHIINRRNGNHVWEVAPTICAMELVNGKSGKSFKP